MDKSSKRRRLREWILIAALVTTVAVALVVRTSRQRVVAAPGSGAESAASGERSDSGATGGASPVSDSVPFAPTREAARDELGECVHGSVIAFSDGRPVRARVTRGDDQAWTDPVTGDFELASTGRADSLAFEADGFWPERLGIDGDGGVDIGTVRLLSTEMTRIKVLAGGEPVSGAGVIGVHVSGNASIEESVGVTGHDGSTVVRLDSIPAILFAFRGNDVSHARAVGARIHELDLDLVGAQRILVTGSDPERSPAGTKLRFETKQPDVVLERSVRVDGTLSAPVPAEVVRVSALGPGARIDSCQPGRRRTGIGQTDWTVDLRQASAVSIVVESPSVGALVLEDAASGERVLAAMLWIEALTPEGWKADARSEGVQAAEDGVFVPRFLTRVRWQPDGQYRLLVSAGGYRSAALGNPRRLVESTAPITLRLERTALVTLEVVDGSRRPYPHEIIVRSDAVPLDLFRDEPVDGRVADLTCEPSDTLQVRTGPFAGAYTVDFPASNAFVDGTPEPYEVEIPTGTIRALVRAEYAEPIECRSKAGTTFVGRRASPTVWLFESMPPGRYAVGPPPTIRSSSVRDSYGRDGYPVVVTPDTLTEVDLRDVMSSTAGTGRLVCEGISPEELFVSPLYGDADLPLVVMNDAERFRVDAAGVYEIPALPLDPPRLYAAYRDANDEVVPVALVEGPVSSVRCMEVELLVQSLPLGTEFVVLWSPRVGGPRVIAMFQEAGVVGQPLRIGPMPIDTDRVTVVSAEGSLFEVVPVGPSNRNLELSF